MTGIVFVAAIAGLPLLGWGLVPKRARSWLPLSAAISVAAGLGALFLSVEMLVMSFLGIRWTAVRVAAIPLFLTAVRIARAPRSGASADEVDSAGYPPAIPAFGILAALLVAAYASLSTRATSADLLFFWGPKAERFAHVGAIDVAFLKDPNHWALHTDYPPLLTSLWAFASLCAGRFAWGASLATLPIAAFFLTLAVWGLARRKGDARGAAWGAAVVAAMAAACWPISGTAGNADPLLILFEGTALLVLLFAGDEPRAAVIVGALLAAAVLTKFEGTFFAGALVAASLLVQPRDGWRRAAIIAAIPAAALSCWVMFCRARGLFSFMGQPTRLYLDASRAAIVARGLLASGPYGAAYLPWIVAAVLLILAMPLTRRTALALTTAALILAADFLIYFVSPADPTQWVAWSGARLLLTPLFCLYAAAADGLAGGGVPSRSSRGRTRTAACGSLPA